MFKVNNKDTNHISDFVSIVNFEHVVAGWVDKRTILFLEKATVSELKFNS